MTLLARGPLGNSRRNPLNENNKSVRKKNQFNTDIRSRRDIAVVDVHDEKPSCFQKTDLAS